jgi:hypothetical protein
VIFSFVRFQMSFEEAQRVDSCATALADGGALFGFSDRDFLKHGCQ